MMFECIDKIYPSVSIDTVTGSICNFTDNIGGLPLKSCTSLISGYQEGSGTPSPDNVRPLHAFSSGTLTANGNTYTFTFGQSIYQGYIDWKRGVVIASRVILRDYTNIQIYAQAIFANTCSYRFETPIDRAKDTFCLSNKFHADVLTDGTNYCFEVSATNTDWVRKSIFFALPASYDTVDKAKQYLIDNNVMFAYGLMNPIEIPLGGINLLTQEGVNNIFADCGDTTVEYINIT